MSLESGRHLGRIASLIYVSVPVIMVVVYVAYFLSLLASIPVTTTTIPNTPVLTGFIIAIILLGIIAFAGLILFFIAMHRLSHYYNEPGIFSNILYGLILGIVGSVVVVLIMFGFLFSLIGNLIGQAITTPSSSTAFLAQFFVLIAIVILVALALAIASGFLYMRAFNKLAASSGVEGFRTVGILYLIGMIVPIVAWVAWIIAYMNFNKLKPREPAPAYAYTVQPPITPPVAGLTKRCVNCGTENNTDAIFCRNCGKPI